MIALSVVVRHELGDRVLKRGLSEESHSVQSRLSILYLGRESDIGLGGGSLAKFCYRHLPNSRITVVEIN
jgi:hypothetical protein